MVGQSDTKAMFIYLSAIIEHLQGQMKVVASLIFDDPKIVLVYLHHKRSVKHL